MLVGRKCLQSQRVNRDASLTCLSLAKKAAKKPKRGPGRFSLGMTKGWIVAVRRRPRAPSPKKGRQKMKRLA